MELPPDDLKSILGPNEQIQLYIRKSLVRYQTPFTAAASGVPPLRQPPPQPIGSLMKEMRFATSRRAEVLRELRTTCLNGVG